MKGPEIAKAMGEKPSQAREDLILEMVKSGNAILNWRPIKVDMGPYRATFYVTAEPLMLGESWEDGFYPGMSPVTMQKVADYYNATLLTPKLVDEIWKQSDFKLDPFVSMVVSDEDARKMADTSTYLKHSQIVKEKVRYARQIYSYYLRKPLVSNIGKYWTVSAFTSRKGKTKYGSIASENYGFFYTKKGTPPRSVTLLRDVHVVQTPGHAHDYHHMDYSQVAMLVSRTVELCKPSGVSGFGAYYNCKTGGPCETSSGPGTVECIDIYDLLNDPNLANLASHEGTINGRLPGVPYQNPESCALLALAGIGEYSPAAEAFGGTVCGKDPPAPGPIGRGAKAIAPQPPPGAPPVPVGTIPKRTSPGDVGPEVVAWQTFLIQQGYTQTSRGVLKPDGDHGAITEEASRDYEADHPTLNPDKDPDYVGIGMIAGMLGLVGFAAYTVHGIYYGKE